MVSKQKFMKKAFFLLIIAVGLLIAGSAYTFKIISKNYSPAQTTILGSPTIKSEESDSEKVTFRNFGQAPEFKGLESWINSQPLSISQLKGRVVLVNFWTYSCITCIRAVPRLTQWHKSYYDQGLTVVSIHTPEYAFEKVPANLSQAIQRHEIAYPIGVDNNYAMWRAYKNQFWPATYLIDKEGKIVFSRYGEGGFEVTENAFRQLLGLAGGLDLPPGETIIASENQEISFGVASKAAASNEKPSENEQVYTLPDRLKLNTFALEGTWKFTQDKVMLTQGYGRIRTSFKGNRVTLLADSIKPVIIKVIIDHKSYQEVAIQPAQEYELFADEKSKNHVMDIEIPQAGFTAFKLTVEQ
jgi:thiol-disulfide isomerase/thioredoxin